MKIRLFSLLREGYKFIFWLWTQRLNWSSSKIRLIYLAVGMLPVQTYASNEQAFKEFLSNNTPIETLRYTEIDCQTGDKHQFLASVDHENFFLREYNFGEDPNSLISSNNIPKHLIIGQYGDQSWQINGFLITKASASDSNMHIYNLDVQTARRAITQVLNLGVPHVKRGSFVWRGPTKDGIKTAFAAELQDDIIIKNKNGVPTTNLGGFLIISDDFVSELRSLGVIRYEYASNLPIPLGIPNKITKGNSGSDCQKMYLIEELTYGHHAEKDFRFQPENKFSSTNIFSIFLVANGVRTVLQDSIKNAAATPPSSFSKKSTVAGTRLVLCVALLVPIILFFRIGRMRKN